MLILGSPGYRRELEARLRGAKHVRIVSAFLGSDPSLWGLVPPGADIEVLVSADWTVNDPRDLQRLEASGARVRVIDPESPGGRLHVKAISAIDQSGKRLAALGSANITRPGLHLNRELGCLLDETSDGPSVDAIERELDQLWTAGRPVADWTAAIQVWLDGCRPHGPRATGGSSGTQRAWLIKTTVGSGGPSCWPHFLAESVIAIGWEGVQGDPATMTRSQLDAAVVAAGFDKKNAAQIWNFFHAMQIGDAVAIVRGFSSNQRTEGYLYGFATIRDFARACPAGGPWWRFKREVHLVPVME